MGNSRVKCLACGEILESKYRHAFVSCGCSNNTFVDGGSAYLRCGGKDFTMIQILGDTDEKS
jgi:hypothetical protein